MPRMIQVRGLASPPAPTADEAFLPQKLVLPSAPGAPKNKYGGRFMVTLLPGDGIGPEMMDYVKTVFKAGGIPVDFEEVHLDSMHETLEVVDQAITAIKRNGVALKGNIETREHSKHFRSRNVELRLKLNLFANIVHCKSHPGIVTRHKDVDLVIIRQNTEGEYSCLEHESVSGVIESIKVITQEKAEQIARYAFEWAKKNNRKKVTCVHKANIMKVSDGLFLKCCGEVAQDYPEIKFDNIIIDNCSMQLVSHPGKFDVLVLPNLYGNILTNIACGIIGGPGILSGANYGTDYAVFETATRNTGKAVAGKNIANPLAMFNASADLLEYLGLERYSSIIRSSIDRVLNKAKVHTPDLGGEAKTTDVVDFILHDVKQKTQVL